MSFFNFLPIQDWLNQGWSMVGTAVTQLYQALDNDDDTKYIKCPASKGGAAIRFPVDTSNVPEGAVITSVTVKLRVATGTGSAPAGTSPSVTVNVIAEDNTARFTSRTIFPNGTPTTYVVATYHRDALGELWDVHRLNHIVCRLFVFAAILDLIRCYKLFCEVNYRVRPTLEVTAPTGTVNTPSPVLSWTYTQTDGDPQKKAEYKIFTAADKAAVSFNPETTAPVFSDSVDGEISSVTLPSSLNANDYWLYVRATSTYGAKSIWTGKAFSVLPPSPQLPGVPDPTGNESVILDVVPDVEQGSGVLTLRDRTNLLSIIEADAEVAADGTGFTTVNTAVARNTSQSFPGGSASWSLTSAAGGTMSISTRYEELIPNEAVTAMAQFKTAVSARSARVRVLFYDSSYTLLGTSLTGTSITDATGTWTEATVTGTSPADTAYARVVAEVLSTGGASEVHYVDHLGLAYGTDTPWSDGGHASRNLLSSWYSTGDGTAQSGEAWTAGSGTTVSTTASPPGTGAEGSANTMTYAGLTPSIAYRAAGATFNSATSGTNYTLTKPAGVATGDLLLGFITCNEHTTINPPAGWTLVNSARVDDGTTDTSMFVVKRTATGSEPASWTDGTVATSATRRAAVCVAYSGAADAAQQFIAENQVASGNATPLHITTPTITNTDPNAWRISAFAASDNVTGGALTANTQEPSTVPAISYVGKGSHWESSDDGTSYTINKPSGAVTGDLMIATVVIFLNDSYSSFTPPTGWTVVEEDSADHTLHVVMYKYHDGSEPTSWSGSVTGEIWFGKFTQILAYRNVHATVPFIAENGNISDGPSSITTPSVTNTNSAAWRVCSFGSTTTSTISGWSTNEVIQRAARTGSTSYFFATYAMQFMMADSNGPVSTGSHNRYGAHADGKGSWNIAGWIGLLNPLGSAPSAPANETSRSSVSVGSSDPWMGLGVFDSNGVVASGSHQVSGIWTPGSGTDKHSMAGWVGLIKPAAAQASGYTVADMATTVDISSVNMEDVSDTEHVAITASFVGTVGGTPYLTAHFYRANQLINSVVAQGSSFGTSVWQKSSAVFDVPEGTTRMKVGVSAADQSIGDIVYWDRVSLAFGTDTTYRPGTSRNEHPIWAAPQIQYADDSGDGYGDWQELPGILANPPNYIPLSGLANYTDHTVIPLVNRKYRARTISYGLNGDRFVSEWGPPSSEFSFVARNWWLKDISNAENNIELKVKWDTFTVTSTNTATVFQPLGEDLPVVLTEGYKGNQFSVNLRPVRSDEWAVLQGVLRSGRTLFLQTDVDNAWWVRPVGDLAAVILATSQRQSNPLREVNVGFVEVAAEL